MIRASIPADGQPAVELISTLRKEAHSAGGNLFIERAPASVRERCDAWDWDRGLTGLMQGLKQNFDPQSLLNAGKFIAGI
jgi:glycolate oxidase FAD binding subunit